MSTCLHVYLSTSLIFYLIRNYIIAENNFTYIPTPFYFREGNSAILPISVTIAFSKHLHFCFCTMFCQSFSACQSPTLRSSQAVSWCLPLVISWLHFVSGKLSAVFFNSRPECVNKEMVIKKKITIICYSLSKTHIFHMLYIL